MQVLTLADFEKLNSLYEVLQKYNAESPSTNDTIVEEWISYRKNITDHLTTVANQLFNVEMHFLYSYGNGHIKTNL